MNLQKLTKKQATPLLRKAQKSGVVTVDTSKKRSFVKHHQNSGVVLEGPAEITLRKLWKIADNSILGQYPLIFNKVKPIVTSLLETGILNLDLAVAELPNGQMELVSGRHRAAAIKLWFQLSNKNPQEFEHMTIRVLKYKASSKEDLAKMVQVWNDSRNMTQSEKCYVDRQSWGIEDTCDSIIENAHMFSSVVRSAHSKAMGALVERLIRTNELDIPITVDTALHIGKGIYNYIYLNSNKEIRKDLRKKETLHFMYMFIKDNLINAVNYVFDSGRNDIARSGVKTIVDYIGALYLEEETNAE